MPKPTRDSNSSLPTVSVRLQWGIRILLLFHFFAVVLTYSANWQRSTTQDKLLGHLQPYLIGGSWYHEMLPVEWASDSIGQKPSRISIQTADAPSEWIIALDSSGKNEPSARSQRLLHVLTELAVSEDTQGLTNVLKSIVLHLENDPAKPNQKLVALRLERHSDLTTETESQAVLYEASLARFPSGEFGFVPKVESHRSVRSLESEKGAP